MRRYTMVPCLSIFASGRGAVGSFWRYWWFPFAIDLLLTGIGRLSGCRHGLWLLPFTVQRLFGGVCISQSSSSSSKRDLQSVTAMSSLRVACAMVYGNFCNVCLMFPLELRV